MSSIIKPHAASWTSTSDAVLLEMQFQAANSEEADRDASAGLAEDEAGEAQRESPEERAAGLIADAEERATEILLAAQARAEETLNAARAEGRARGEEEALAAWSERLARLERRAAEMEEERVAYYQAAETELAALSVDIARKVLKQELAQSPDAVLSVVRACMHRLKEKEARIRVNPEDLDTVRDARESFLGIADGLSELEIVSDRRVGHGGCIVETPSGNMDARLETQLEHIEQVLTADTESLGHAEH